MKITYKGDYALKALLQLAIQYKEDGGEGVMSITDIAEKGDMPTNFLEQILLALRKGGFVKSRRGIKGGFYLARPPAEITMGAVIRFIEGSLAPIACIEDDQYAGCKDMGCCIFRDIWKEVDRAVSVVVDTLTFEELLARHADRVGRVKEAYEYSI